MATEEERLAAVEESLIQQQAASLTLLGVVQESDKKLDKLTSAMQTVQVNGIIVDARLNAMDARLSTVDARVQALSQDVIASARQNEQRMGRIEDKLDQVIALLSQKSGE